MKWTAQMKSDAQRRHAAERTRLTALPGESAQAYIKRMHLTDTGRTDASRRAQRTPGSCNCPVAYSMCKYGMHYLAQTGANRTTNTHGGWGWSSYWDEQGNPIDIPESSFR
jgi:hypothetical protein